MNYLDLDTLFATPIYSVKDKSDTGTVAPCYIRNPRYEECFAVSFLKHIDEYNDVEIHDKQCPGKANSMDLFCKHTNIGIEVTQAINDAYRREENEWNKELCQRKYSFDIVHKWKNRPTSMERIKEAVDKKISKYDGYMKDYHPSAIDLFVFLADAFIVDDGQKYLRGIPIGQCGIPQLGFPAHIDIGNALCDMFNGMQIPYRKIFLVFGNYWYIYTGGKIQNNIWPEGKIDEVYRATKELQDNIFEEEGEKQCR